MLSRATDSRKSSNSSLLEILQNVREIDNRYTMKLLNPQSIRYRETCKLVLGKVVKPEVKLSEVRKSKYYKNLTTKLRKTQNRSTENLNIIIKNTRNLRLETTKSSARPNGFIVQLLWLTIFDSQQELKFTGRGMHVGQMVVAMWMNSLSNFEQVNLFVTSQFKIHKVVRLRPNTLLLSLKIV